MDLTNKRIVVIGGAGLVGSHIVGMCQCMQGCDAVVVMVHHRDYLKIGL